MYIYYIYMYIYYIHIHIYIYIYMTWRLTKAMAEMKLDTEQTMKLE